MLVLVLVLIDVLTLGSVDVLVDSDAVSVEVDGARSSR